MKFLIGGLVLGLLAVMLFMSMSNSNSAGDAAANQTVTQTATARPPTLYGNVSTATIGTPGAGTTLTGTQCRATCRGKCGRRPLLAITARQKAAKACHNNCRATTCQWISDKDYGYDE